tara:strand:+ start:35869 stop:37017 length:1149 start_codon:yes stop_codon:yes gene_type:complete
MNQKDQLNQPDLLFVISEFSFLITHRLNLIKHLSNDFPEIVIATNLKGVSNKDIKSLNLPRGIRFVDYYVHRSAIGITNNLSSLFRLFKILHSLKPIRLFLVSSKPIVMGGICSLFLPIKKTYYNISGLGYLFISEELKAKIVKNILILIYRLIFLKKGSKIIFQNKDDLNYFVDSKVVKESKAELLEGNGVDTDLFIRKKRPRTITFLFASRLLIDKGIDHYLVAARSLSDLEVKFKVAGRYDKDNPNCLSQEDMDKMKLDSSVEYLGEVDYEEMPELFNSSDVFVLPSYREGLPKVALEAACSEMPLILSDVNGCRDCLVNGETGYLVRIKSWEDIRDKMLYFLKNKDQISVMGKKSREYVKSNFSEKVLFKKYDLLFKK